MPRGFLRSVISTLLLLGLLVVTIINVWQSDRIEKNQIELLNRINAVEKTIENGDFASSSGRSGPSGGIFGVTEPAEVLSRNARGLAIKPTSGSPPPEQQHLFMVGNILT